MQRILQLFIGTIIGMLMVITYTYVTPVVILMKAEDWKIHDNSISALVTGFKIRDCIFIDGSEVGYISNNNIIQQVDFHFDGVYDHPTSKPSNKKFRLSFDRWSWDNIPNIEDDKIEVTATVKHNCSDQIIQTTIGPFEVPSEIIQKIKINS